MVADQHWLTVFTPADAKQPCIVELGPVFVPEVAWRATVTRAEAAWLPAHIHKAELTCTGTSLIIAGSGTRLVVPVAQLEPAAAAAAHAASCVHRAGLLPPDASTLPESLLRSLASRRGGRRHDRPSLRTGRRSNSPPADLAAMLAQAMVGAPSGPAADASAAVEADPEADPEAAPDGTSDTGKR
jgi:hypothetical protein